MCWMILYSKWFQVLVWNSGSVGCYLLRSIFPHNAGMILIQPLVLGYLWADVILFSCSSLLSLCDWILGCILSVPFGFYSIFISKVSCNWNTQNLYGPCLPYNAHSRPNKCIHSVHSGQSQMDRNPVYNGQIAADTSPFSFSAMVMVIVFFTSVLSYYHYN